MVQHHVSPTFGGHSFYVPFVRLWERVSTLTFSTSQSSRSTYKSIKSPQNYICTIGLLKQGLSSASSIFSAKQKVLVSFVAFGYPRTLDLALPRELDTLHNFVSVET